MSGGVTELGWTTCNNRRYGEISLTSVRVPVGKQGWRVEHYTDGS